MQRKRSLFTLIIVLVLALGLVGCGEEEAPVTDPSLVDMLFTTEPNEVKAEEEVKLLVTIEGLNSYEGLDVNFEIVDNGEREYIYADHENENVFSIMKSFPAAGRYDVIIHLNTPEMHVQEDTFLEVGP